jgi:hypothetical protein
LFSNNYLKIIPPKLGYAGFIPSSYLIVRLTFWIYKDSFVVWNWTLYFNIRPLKSSLFYELSLRIIVLTLKWVTLKNYYEIIFTVFLILWAHFIIATVTSIQQPCLCWTSQWISQMKISSDICEILEVFFFFSFW